MEGRGDRTEELAEGELRLEETLGLRPPADEGRGGILMDLNTNQRLAFAIQGSRRDD